MEKRESRTAKQACNGIKSQPHVQEIRLFICQASNPLLLLKFEMARLDVTLRSTS